jgi:lysophospholipase L1-like esterase
MSVRNRKAPVAFFFVGSLLLAGLLLPGVSCTRRVPAISRLAPGATILAFGDSLTYGTGVEAADSYPAVLEALSGHPVVNAGVPGEVSEEGLRRLPDVLDRERPALLVLCHGGNDLLRQSPEDLLAENLAAMTDLAARRGIAVVLIGVPRPGLFLRTAAVYETLAREKNLAFDDRTLPSIESEPSLKSDPIHPNREGYRKMAQAVFDLLKESGAL